MVDYSKSPPPWQTSQTVVTMDITGYLFPWRSGQPVFVLIGGTDDYFLPLFATAQKLRDLMTAIKVEFDRIKQINNQREFLASIPTEMPNGERIRIIVDPNIISTGNTRFREVIR